MANLIRRGGGGRETPQVAPRWDPFRIMREMLGDTGEAGLAAPWGEQMFSPPFEVLERKDAYIFKADLPGLREEDLDIQLTGNRLTVSGKREAEKVDESDRYYAYERMYGTFSRSFTLPEGIDAEHVRAELKEGVLNLIVPKKPEVQPKRIQIKPETPATGKTEKAKA